MDVRVYKPARTRHRFSATDAHPLHIHLDSEFPRYLSLIS
jgi:hypothetical protein